MAEYYKLRSTGGELMMRDGEGFKSPMRKVGCREWVEFKFLPAGIGAKGDHDVDVMLVEGSFPEPKKEEPKPEVKEEPKLEVKEEKKPEPKKAEVKKEVEIKKPFAAKKAKK